MSSFTMAQIAEFLAGREMPAPVRFNDLWITVGVSDQRAAELMQWMESTWPDLHPVEFLSVLHSALWWFMLFESMRGPVNAEVD